MDSRQEERACCVYGHSGMDRRRTRAPGEPSAVGEHPVCPRAAAFDGLGSRRSAIWYILHIAYGDDVFVSKNTTRTEKHVLCIGLKFNTTNISDELLKKFEFGPGELWFGSVICDEPNELISHGVLTLLSKRALPTHRVIVDKASQQMTLVDHPSLGAIPFSVRAPARPSSPCPPSGSTRVTSNIAKPGDFVGCSQGARMEARRRARE